MCYYMDTLAKTSDYLEKKYPLGCFLFDFIQ